MMRVNKSVVIATLKKIYIPGTIALAVILAFAYLYGEKHVYGEWIVYDLETFVRAGLIAVRYLIAFVLLYLVITNIGKIRFLPLAWSKMQYRKRYLCIFTALIIFWLPHLLVEYPACNASDTLHQCRMILGLDPLTTHHPLMHTLCMGVFLQTGNLLGSLNIGIFLFVFFEMIVFALVFSYVLSYFYAKNIPDLMVPLTFLFFVCSPYITGYLGSPLKDCLYSAGAVLLTLLLAQFLLEEAMFQTRRDQILLLIAGCMVIWFRNDGKYQIVVTFTMLAIMAFKARNRKALMAIAVAFFVPLAIQTAFTLWFKPTPGNIREMLSMPAQQTARLLRDRPEVVTEEERKVLATVLPVNEVGEAYSEYWADAVKNTLDVGENNERLLPYLRVWFKQFWKAPKCYFDATACQNIYLIYPRFNTHKYYLDANANTDENMFTRPEWIESLRGYYEQFLEGMHTLPILRSINNMAYYCILLLVFPLYLMKSKSYRLLLMLVPGFMTLLIIIAGPTIRTCVRYAFPIIWASPIWICTLSVWLTEKNSIVNSKLSHRIYCS